MQRVRNQYGQVDTDEDLVANGNGHATSDRQAFSLDLREHDTNGLLALDEDDDMPVGTIYPKRQTWQAKLKQHAAHIGVAALIVLILVGVGVAIAVSVGQRNTKGAKAQVAHKGPAGSSGGQGGQNSIGLIPAPAPQSTPSQPDTPTPSQPDTPTPQHAPPVTPAVTPAVTQTPKSEPPPAFPLSATVLKPGISSACPIKGTDIPEGYLSEKQHVDYSIYWNVPENLFYPDTPSRLPPVEAKTGITFAVQAATPCVYFHWGPPTDSLHSIHLRAEDGKSYYCVCNTAAPQNCTYPTCKDAVQVAKDSDLKALSLTKADGATPLVHAPETNWTVNFTHSIFASDSKTQYGLWQSEPFPISDSVEIVTMISTQLEPSGARLIMPCFDEPQYKGTFTLNMTLLPLNKGSLAQFPLPVSNAFKTSHPTERKNPYADQIVEFMTTPPMSTYLFAVALGPVQPCLYPDLARIVPASLGKPYKYKIIAYAQKGFEEQSRLATVVGWRSVAFYDELLDVDNGVHQYELVPVISKEGAMENWGALMFDPERFTFTHVTHGLHEASRTGNVVCHEMAHQWFGNLVSPKTWGDIVVNEGSASYLEYECMQAVVPFMNGAILRHRMINPSGAHVGVHEGPRHNTLVADAAPDVASILTGTLPPATFGFLSYSKGAAVLDMIAMFLGLANAYTESTTMPSSQSPPMKAALRTYLMKHAYSSATIEDLLLSFANQAALLGDNIGGGRRLQQQHGHISRAALADSFKTEELRKMWLDYFYTWMTQPGYPVVSLKVATPNQPAPVTVKASQERFCSYGFLEEGELVCPKESESGARYSWWVPLITSDLIDPMDNPISDVLMLRPVDSTNDDKPEAQLELKHVDAHKPWTISAVAACAPFRVAYPAEHVPLLLTAVKELKVTEQCIKSGTCANAAAGLQKRARQLQKAAAIVEDEIALGLSPMMEDVNATRIVMAINAVAAAKETLNGAGAYMLLNPVLDGLVALRRHLRAAGKGGAECYAKFKAWGREALRDASMRLIKQASKGSVLLGPILSPPKDPKNVAGPSLLEQEDEFFSNLLVSRAASMSVLLEDSDVSSQLCAIFNANIVARKLTPAQLSTSANKIPPDLRDAVYQAAARSVDGCWSAAGDNSVSAWKLFMGAYEQSSDPIEARRALFAAAAIPEKSLQLLLHVFGAPGGATMGKDIPPSQLLPLVVALNQAAPDAAVLGRHLDRMFALLWDGMATKLQGAPGVWEELALDLVLGPEDFDKLQQALTAEVAKDASVAPLKDRVLGRVKSSLVWRDMYLEELCALL